MRTMHVVGLLILGLSFAGLARSGTLTNLAVTPAVSTVGTTTQYTVTFRSPSTTFGPGKALRINNAPGAGGNTNFAGATVQSASGGLVMTVGLAAATEIYVYPSGASATVPINTTVTIVFNGLTNPTVSNGNGYLLEVGILDGSAIDTGTALGNTYTANPAPFVVSAIPDIFSAEEQSGQVVASADLNNNFDDGDNDPMSFAIQNNTLPAAVTTQITGNALRVTPIGFGHAVITVRASDGQDGFADDTFNVHTIGFLSSPSITPADTIVGRTTQYTFAFTTDSAVSAGDFFILSNGVSGPNHSNSTLVSLSGGLNGTKSSGSATSTVIQINSGNVAANTPLTLVLGNLVNPANAGVGPQYLIEKTNGSEVEDRARLLGTNYLNAPDNVFSSGFEASGRAAWKAVGFSPGTAETTIWYDPVNDQYRIGKEIRGANESDVPGWLARDRDK